MYFFVLEFLHARRAGGALLVVALLLGSVAFIPSAAQAQERQVAFDSNDTLYRITPDLRERLDLFPEVEGFEEATLFQVGESSYELVIAYLRGNTRLRERRPLTSEEVATLRRRVDGAMREMNIRPNLNQDGRLELLTFTPVFGSITGALLVAAMAEEPSDELFLAVQGLLSGAGFFIPLYATRNRAVTPAMAEMTVYGGLQGYVHGAQLAVLLGGGDVKGRPVAGTMGVLGVAGAGTGLYLASANNWSDGHSAMVAFTGTYGNLVGFAAGIAAREEGERARLVGGLSLAGSLTGAGVGHWLGRTGRYSPGDARVYLLGSVQATQLALSALVAAEEEDDRTIAAVLGGSSLVGLAAGAIAVRQRDFSTYEANLIAVGGLAGSSILAGAGEISGVSDRGLIVMQALGSVAGSALTYGFFSDDARRRARRTSGLRWDWRITPAIPTAHAPDGRVRLGSHPVPQLTVSARF